MISSPAGMKPDPHRHNEYQASESKAMNHDLPYRVYFDEEEAILYGVYGPKVTPDITASLYNEGIALALEIGQENIRAYLFDFRQVRQFDKRTMVAVQTQSVRVNATLDLSDKPTVLLVSSTLQERIVKISMQTTPGQRRKSIVHCMDEARKFIDNWYAAKSG